MEYLGEKARRQDMDPPPMAKYRQSDYVRQTYLARLSSFSVSLSTLSGHFNRSFIFCFWSYFAVSSCCVLLLVFGCRQKAARSQSNFDLSKF